MEPIADVVAAPETVDDIAPTVLVDEIELDSTDELDERPLWTDDEGLADVDELAKLDVAELEVTKVCDGLAVDDTKLEVGWLLAEPPLVAAADCVAELERGVHGGNCGVAPDCEDCAGEKAGACVPNVAENEYALAAFAAAATPH